MEAFSNVFLRSASFNDGAFFGKKQSFWSWGYSSQVLDYQDLQNIRHRIKGILLYMFPYCCLFYLFICVPHIYLLCLCLSMYIWLY
jgi:hypothetical protein